ncbi:hypothetical protein MLD38_002766 [Melastoma candidum]|uniref:Uncharacterized protein n=1 Tax=Melastoma candidum TaxID=119954 RepID=A0ACB9S0I7_9MYRT|nr:hypothetical protein MLD38_002766 [Melastoma candidum]
MIGLCWGHHSWSTMLGIKNRPYCSLLYKSSLLIKGIAAPFLLWDPKLPLYLTKIGPQYNDLFMYILSLHGFLPPYLVA